MSNAPWRSKLYPEDWTPSFTDSEGQFLHDFSYAGYRYGETDAFGPDNSNVFDAVADFGADLSGASDATPAIQAAIDAAQEAGGGVVHLPAGLYRCDGTLRITRSRIILRGDGPESSRLYFTKSVGMAYQGHIMLQGSVQTGAEFLLAADGENRSDSVYVSDALGLAVGDEVSVGWIITDAFIAEHGMTGTWTVSRDQWRPIFRRTVKGIDVSVSPHRATLDVPLRYPAKMRDSASLRMETGYIEECGVEHLGISNAVAWDDAWSQMQVYAIQIENAKDGWVDDVKSFRSPSPDAEGYHLQGGGIAVVGCKRMTIADCDLEKAQNRGTGGCGYLFQISQCSEVLIRDCVGRDGRHNFIQNWDFGTSGCVFLRCSSSESRNVLSKDWPVSLPAYCEFHHSLAMACLVDSCTLDDGWYGGNRRTQSSGAGHTVTQSVFWNTSGSGKILSWQYGVGYIIGTGKVRAHVLPVDLAAQVRCR